MMPTMPISTPTLSPSPRWRALLTAAIAAFAVLGCGGGSDVGSGGTGAPLSFSQGPVSGFGSIVVNGVHFDDSSAIVQDDDSNALSAVASLRLGTMVDVQAAAVVSNAASASAIHVHADLIGPVTAAFDAGTGTIEVMGQTVKINASTALDEFASGSVGIAVGRVVAVSSLYDADTGIYVATRIEPDAGVSRYVLRGVVTTLDTATHTFTVGDQTFAYGSLAMPTDFAAGFALRVALQTTRNGAGQWVVRSISSGFSAPANGRRGVLRGCVGAITDATHFKVAGVNVDASKATFTPTGASVGVRSRVTVQGTVSNGVLVATQVAVDASGDDDGDHGSGAGSLQFDSAILAVDSVHQTFTLRGPTVISYATASWSNGIAANLSVGVKVTVRGSLSGDGTQVIATSVKFDR